MTQKAIDVVLSVVAGAVSFGLSWPFWRDFEFWAESRWMWWIYFVLGFGLAVYVFYVFIAVTRMLFLHDSLIARGSIKPGETLDDATGDTEGVR